VHPFTCWAWTHLCPCFLDVYPLIINLRSRNFHKSNCCGSLKISSLRACLFFFWLTVAHPPWRPVVKSVSIYLTTWPAICILASAGQRQRQRYDAIWRHKKNVLKIKQKPEQGIGFSMQILPTIVGHFHKSVAIQESVLLRLVLGWGICFGFCSPLIACKDARNWGKVSYSVWAINKTDLAWVF